MELTKDTIIHEVEHLDPHLEKSEEAFSVAAILLSGAVVGANAEKIAKFLGIPLADVAKYEKQLRENGIWVDDKTVCDWFDEESGSIAFWMDVETAMGYLERVKKN